jgi:hypothetical protein
LGHIEFIRFALLQARGIPEAPWAKYVAHTLQSNNYWDKPMRRKYAATIGALALCAVSGVAWANPNAATGYFQDFNSGSASWEGIVIPAGQTFWANTFHVNDPAAPGADGQPGYMRSVVNTGRLGWTFDANVFTSQSAVGGSYGGNEWTVTADVQLERGTFDDVMLRFRYQDPTFNGWSNQLTSEFGRTGWFSVSETFNPLWTDAEARAHGWRPDDEVLGGSAPMSWATTMSNVYTAEIRFSGQGTGHVLFPQDRFLVAGVDNFRLSAVQQAAPVPEPETYALMLAGLGLLGMVARRRKQRGD